MIQIKSIYTQKHCIVLKLVRIGYYFLFGGDFMHFMQKSFFTLSTVLFLISGCVSPDYISNAPVTQIETLPMNQADTAIKLNKICTTTISSTGSLMSAMTKYLDRTVDTTLRDKEQILINLTAVSDSISTQQKEINAFNPAQALSQRTSDIKMELSNLESYAIGLKSAIKDDDEENIVKFYSELKASIANLETLSIM